MPQTKPTFWIFFEISLTMSLILICMCLYFYKYKYYNFPKPSKKNKFISSMKSSLIKSKEKK